MTSGALIGWLSAALWIILITLEERSLRREMESISRRIDRLEAIVAEGEEWKSRSDDD
jgi:hypothetical protein